jgi:hypothetical protein
MNDTRGHKPTYTVTTDQAHDGDRLTVTVTVGLTPHGAVRYQQLLRRVGDQGVGIKTSEGTLLLLPPPAK